jgi:hypothetical protein
VLFAVCKTLKYFKYLVCNKAAPEGSIAEDYLVNELVTFCSMYLENTPTVHNRPQ